MSHSSTPSSSPAAAVNAAVRARALGVAPPGPDTSLPRADVAPITGTPHPNGLLSVATVVEAGGGHWQNGVQFESDNCTTGSTFANVCGDQPTKDFEPVGEFLYGDPFTVTDGLVCGMASSQFIRDAEARVRRRLELSEGYQVEQAFYTGLVNGPGGSQAGIWPNLASSATTVLSAGTPLDPVLALGMLEQAWARVSRVRGVLHVNPMGLALMSEGRFTHDTDDGRIFTRMGSQVVVGTGYGDTGPNGEAADPNVVWMYITGPIVIRRSEVFVPGSNEERFDRLGNKFRIVAERTYVIQLDCGGVIAAPVYISC